MNRAIYRKVARQHRTSVAEVKQEMRLAINAAYVKPNAAALAVPRVGEIPTPDEFINHCVRKIDHRPINALILH